MGMFRTPAHFSSPEKTAPRRQEGTLDYMQVCNKGNRPSEHQRPGIKLQSLAFYVCEDASIWAHWIHSFHICTSCIWINPVSLFILLLAFPQPLRNHCGGWQHPLHHSFGSPLSHLKARNYWCLWHFSFIDMAGDIFISELSCESLKKSICRC